MTVVVVAVAIYLYLAFTCFFTQVTFLASYRVAFQSSGSRKAALRAAMDVFTGRPPFDVLRPADVDRLVDVFDLVRNPIDVSKIIRAVDRQRDAARLKDPEFLSRLKQSFRDIRSNEAT